MPRGGNPRITITGDASGVDRATREAEKSLDRLERAGGRASAGLRTSIGGAGSKASLSFGAGIAPVAGLAAGAGVLAGTAFVKSLSGAMDTEEANNKLQAQLGLNTKESARLGRIAGRVYAANYGESLGEVNGAIKSVVTDIDGMRKASSSRLKGITGDVISLSKAFDQDLGGVTRAVGQMLRTGLADNAQDALNIITVGFQGGADKAGDFLDTLNEYGTQFRKLGLDGKAATGLISQGLKAGARDSDIVADSIKEFSIRAVDGSKTTSDGFKALGLDADKMSEKIAKGGGPAAKGLDQVLDRLRAIKDPVKQSQAAVELFGTQAEDLGKALYALDPSKAADGLNKVEGAARKVNTTMGQGTKSQLTALKRELEVTASSLAQRISPTIGKAAGALTGLFSDARKGNGAFSGVGAAVDRVKTKISDWVQRNRGDINSVINAFKTVGRFAKEVFIDTALPIIRRYAEGVGKVLDGIVHVIRGLVRVISGLLSGDWKKAWDGAKEVVSGAWKVIKASVVTLAKNTWEIIKDLGPKLIKGLLAGLKGIGTALATGIYEGIKLAARELPGLAAKALKGIGGWIADTVTGAIGGIGKKIGGLFGDGIGDGVGKLKTSIPAFGGSLMGARPSMAPVAGIASRFGLGVSSGLRPGAITSSGNRSYHSTGEALDIAGTPAGMLAFFRYMKATWGPRLAELIHTPGGAGVRNGHAFTYSGQVAADHYDHVHVAIDTGAPGVGDGLGDRKVIQSAASSGGVDPSILWGVWGAESGFSHGPGPVSKAGARGPFQFMPDTARAYGVTPSDFKSSAYGAARYLGTYKSRGLAGMLAAYNAGPGGNPNNAETRAYIPRVLAFAKGWKAAAGAGGGTPTAKSKSGRSVAVGADGVPREQPAPTTRLVTLSDGRRVRLPIGDDSPFRPFDGKSIKGINPDAPPAERETSTVADVQSGGGAFSDLLDAAPSAEDYALSAIARARLTPDNSDDVAAATNLRDIRKRAMDRALDTADPRDDAATIDAYLEAVDALKALNDTTVEANRLAQQRLEVDQQIAENGARMAAVAERTTSLQGQFLAWLSSAMGGTVALGMQAAGTPGVMARY
jgi:TP901 family phage tail tape measure protein